MTPPGRPARPAPSGLTPRSRLLPLSGSPVLHGGLPPAHPPLQRSKPWHRHCPGLPGLLPLPVRPNRAGLLRRRSPNRPPRRTARLRWSQPLPRHQRWHPKLQYLRQTRLPPSRLQSLRLLRREPRLPWRLPPQYLRRSRLVLSPPRFCRLHQRLPRPRWGLPPYLHPRRRPPALPPSPPRCSQSPLRLPLRRQYLRPWGNPAPLLPPRKNRGQTR